MTVRVYLTSARVSADDPRPDDLPAERVFVHASDLQEVWVETESTVVPEPGRAVSFALSRSLEIGFGRISGTVERTITKQGRVKSRR